MEDKYQNKYRIASARWQEWDYGWDAAYFVTVCTRDRAHCFGEIAHDKVDLTPVGIIADVLWHEITNHAKNVGLGAFVVMPNHIHGILVLDGNDADRDKGTEIDGIGPDSDIPDGDDDVPGSDGNVPVETRHALSLPQPQPQPQPRSLPLQQPSPPFQPPPFSTDIPGQRRFQNQGKNTISSIMGGYKSAVTKHANRMGLEFGWQSRFHDHVIRDETSFARITEYIINNPKNWKDDRFFD